MRWIGFALVLLMACSPEPPPSTAVGTEPTPTPSETPDVLPSPKEPPANPARIGGIEEFWATMEEGGAACPEIRDRGSMQGQCYYRDGTEITHNYEVYLFDKRPKLKDFAPETVQWTLYGANWIILIRGRDTTKVLRGVLGGKVRPPNA